MIKYDFLPRYYLNMTRDMSAWANISAAGRVSCIRATSIEYPSEINIAYTISILGMLDVVVLGTLEVPVLRSYLNPLVCSFAAI